MSIIYDLLRADGSIVINKNLVSAIGLNEAIVFSELLSKYYYFKERDRLFEDGSFFCTIFDLSISTGLADKAQRTAITKLKKLGLINVIVRGLPAKRYFKISDNQSVIEGFLKNGASKREGLIREHRENNVISPVFPKEETRHSQEQKLDSAEGACNNTNLNNTKVTTILKDKGTVINNSSLHKGTLSDDKSSPLSFSSFVSQYSVDEEVVESVNYYLLTYQEHKGTEHPRLKPYQWAEVVDGWFHCYNANYDLEFDVGMDDMERMINKHFIIKYKKRNGEPGDYNILHFISAGVKVRRMYEEAY